MIHRPFLLASAFIAGLALSLSAHAEPTAETVKVVLKFMKTNTGDGPAVVFDQPSCQACSIGHDEGYAAENGRETILELLVPRRRYLTLSFTVKVPVRRALIETTDLPLTQKGATLFLSLPPLVDDAFDAGELATDIIEPGMVLRMEHADPIRRAGAYKAGDFPVTQRRAADNLTFAQREFIRLSGLGVYVAKEGLGNIQLMGFDTNFPHGHLDSPPHMHMHLRWPEVAGTQIGHFYITEKGLLSKIEVGGPQWLHTPGQTFAPGQIFTTYDKRGVPAYTHTITEQGWLTISRPGGMTCLIRPEEVAGGFDTGAVLECQGQAARHIFVKDDLLGRVLVRTNEIVENFDYDTDTGALKAPPQPVYPAHGFPPKMQ